MIKITNFRILKSNGAEEPITFKNESPLSYNLLKVTTTSFPDRLSVSQFAEAAEITPQAVRKMISENRLKAERLGSQYVIKKDELTRYLQAK